MFLMRADPLRGQVGRGWALESEARVFWAPCNGIEPIGECHCTGPKGSHEGPKGSKGTLRHDFQANL